MVYTLGYKPAYRKGLKEQGKDFRKLGRTGDYTGGSVWKTAKEVFQYIESQGERLKDYGVFEIDADWDRDTASNAYTPFNDLLVTSRIVREVFKDGEEEKTR